MSILGNSFTFNEICLYFFLILDIFVTSIKNNNDTSNIKIITFISNKYYWWKIKNKNRKLSEYEKRIERLEEELCKL